MKINFQGSEKLRRGIEELSENMNLRFGKDGLIVCAESGKDGFTLVREGDSCTIVYEKSSDFYFAFTELITRKKERKYRIEKKRLLDRMGFMADCSRNAVLKVSAVKEVIRNLAALGYDYLMLYTEDTTEIGGQPYYGHLRGRYTKEELEEIVGYAAIFDIEVVPCIQALGHLDMVLKWENYAGIRDTSDVLLVGDEKTYNFLENVIAELKTIFHTNRIHLGMDEAFGLGCGQFLAKNGYVPKTEILKKYLDKVLSICRKYGFDEPYIYSDTIFSLVSGKDSYVSDVEFPPEVKALLANGLNLVYWDYYNEDASVYKKMFDKNAELTEKLCFASGAWKWSGFAPYNIHSERKMIPAVQALKQTAIKDSYVTAWGDDGAECATLAVMPSLLLYSELVFNGGTLPAIAEEKSLFLWGVTRERFKTLDNANRILYADCPFPGYYGTASKFMLYNDPLLGIYDYYVPDDAAEQFQKNASALESLDIKNFRYRYLAGTMRALCAVLEEKADLGLKIRKAYLAGEKETLRRIAAEKIPRIVKKIKTFYAAFRKQWNKENKTFGFEVQDIRIGGLIGRLYDVKERLFEYAKGKTDRIEELEQERLPVYPNTENKYFIFNEWNRMVTAGRMNLKY